MSAKPRTMPKDLVLPVPLARRPGAKARGQPVEFDIASGPMRRGVETNPGNSLKNLDGLLAVSRRAVG